MMVQNIESIHVYRIPAVLSCQIMHLKVYYMKYRCQIIGLTTALDDSTGVILCISVLHFMIVQMSNYVVTILINFLSPAPPSARDTSFLTNTYLGTSSEYWYQYILWTFMFLNIYLMNIHFSFLKSQGTYPWSLTKSRNPSIPFISLSLAHQLWKCAYMWSFF